MKKKIFIAYAFIMVTGFIGGLVMMNIDSMVKPVSKSIFPLDLHLLVQGALTGSYLVLGMIMICSPVISFIKRNQKEIVEKEEKYGIKYIIYGDGSYKISKVDFPSDYKKIITYIDTRLEDEVVQEKLQYYKLKKKYN